MPEVLLGIYTPDEVADGVAQRLEDQSTPRDPTPAPDRRSFQEEQRPIEATSEGEFEEISTVLPGDEQPQETDDAGGAAGQSGDTGAEGAAVDGMGLVDANQHDSDAANPPAGVAGDAASDTSPDTAQPELTAEPAEPVPLLDSVPVDPMEWGMWKREVSAALKDVSDRGQYDRLRKRINDALEKAPDELLVEVQDEFADKLTTIPGSEA
jgi:hypothetical protein